MKLTIHYNTVQYVLKLFQSRGYDFDAMMRPKKPFLMIDDRLKRKLLSAKLLQEWAPFSVRERAQIIRRVWGVQLTWTVLQRFYVANGVKYLRNKEVFAKAQRNRRELNEERKTSQCTSETS